VVEQQQVEARRRHPEHGFGGRDAFGRDELAAPGLRELRQRAPLRGVVLEHQHALAAQRWRAALPGRRLVRARPRRDVEMKDRAFPRLALDPHGARP